MYPKFYDHVKQFGYGMIIFPKVVKELKGHYFLIKDDELDDTDLTHLNDMPASTGRFQIGFRLPFE